MPKLLVRDPDAIYTLPSHEQVTKTIGERIKALRLKHRMSQVELSRNIGKKSAAYLAFIEQGQRNISSADLARLAVHLKVKLSYFYP
jgi:transcriptional regulator with XRE-family HTH domain